MISNKEQLNCHLTATSDCWPENNGILIAGEKAENLHFLTTNGINVPAWMVVTKKSHEIFITPLQNKLKSILKAIDYTDIKQLSAAAKNARNIVHTAEYPDDVESEIKAQLKTFVDESSFYAVRSSAAGEDSEENSFAGQMDSFLFIKGIPDIMDAIRKCWASAYTDRALSYKNHSGLDPLKVEMGVIVQQMVDGDVSGVAFTVNPIEKRFDEILISATYGIGEGIVSGELDTDQFRVNKNTVKLLNTDAAEKTEKLVFDTANGFGTLLKAVPENLQKNPCLTPSEIESIASVFKAIETLYGFPQDIEWTYRNKSLHILQARPVTTISRSEYLEAESVETIWDNSNIVESYSGITSPLTFSFIRHGYYMVYLQFCQILKVPGKVIQAEDNNLRTMLGLLNGQVYYNLKNWYRLVSHLPGYNYNKSFMEQMMGVADEAKFDATREKEISFLRKYFFELPGVIKAGASLAFQFLTMKPRVTVFMKRIARYYEKYRHFNFDAVSTHRLSEIYRELETEVLMHWKAPIVNDFLIMIFYGVLKNLTVSWVKDERGTLANDLLCGQGDVESTLPMKLLLSISEDIKKDPAVLAQFMDNSFTELKERYCDLDASLLSVSELSLKKRIDHYLEEYGFRCMNELKLEEPSLMEKPDFIFMMLKNYAKVDENNTGVDEVAIKNAAEKRVREALKGKYCLKIIPRQFIFNRVLNFSRKGVSFREYQRFARTKMFGIARFVFNAMGRKFFALNVIADPKDIFWLTTEEIFSFVEGYAVSKNLKGIVSARKEEYAGYNDDLGQRIFTRGAVYTNRFKDETADRFVFDEKEGVLRGTSCCPGIVRGRVKVIRSPNDDMSLDNEILVAGKTDPGWVPLYPAAKGVLIERGSILSHSSIVAREMGLPAIVGIPGILEVLKTGDEVEMDGAAGTVTILNRE